MFGQQNWLPPDFDTVKDFSCRVGADAENKHMQAEAIATYANPAKYHNGEPWRMVIGRYGEPLRTKKDIGKARRKMEDLCNAWLDSVDKERATRAKGKQ